MFLLGVICALIFLLCLYGAYRLGEKKPVKAEKTRLEQEQEEIERLTSYNYTTALKERR